ncbi:MAG TPA: protein kinase [Phototrophicaceae bacterium]|jgi:serine/threonine-protein kinase|nr:protein kinase [Phototrophicaceae bacterium]
MSGQTEQTIGGRYQMGEVLGSGGMGVVYRGIDNTTGEPVAIKRLKPDIIAGDPSLLTRFEREGEVLRQLNHPNIVRMLAALQDSDAHYLVMELVETGSLDDLLRSSTPLTLSQSLKIALELADAQAIRLSSLASECVSKTG